jgi:hypothetical protein
LLIRHVELFDMDSIEALKHSYKTRVEATLSGVTWSSSRYDDLERSRANQGFKQTRNHVVHIWQLAQQPFCRVVGWCSTAAKHTFTPQYAIKESIKID